MSTEEPIRAERKETKETKEEDYYCRELWAGHFFREITLPAEVQADKAEATYERGMLRLRLPLKETAKESHIKVKAAGAEAKAAGPLPFGAVPPARFLHPMRRLSRTEEDSG